MQNNATSVQFSKEDVGEINDTLLALTFKMTQSERQIGAAFINMNDRAILITEFLDNEHFSGVESLIIQLNNSGSDAKFKVLINMASVDILKDKIVDLLKMCEVDYIPGNKKDFNSTSIQHTLSSLLKESFTYKIEESEMDLALGAL